jgi:hypothetical protein
MTTNLNQHKHTKKNEKKEIREKIGNCTFYPTSDDDLLKLCNSKDWTSPPKADLHPKLRKQGLQTYYSIHDLGLDIKC